MNCIDYRRLLTSDPGHRGAEAAEHRLSCKACAAHAQQLEQFDRKLAEAMQVSVPRDLESRVMLAATSRARSRRRWYSVAAGAVAGLALSFGFYKINNPAESLHDTVVRHIYHEPELLLPSADVVARPRLVSVLKRAGISLIGDPGEVSYAGVCYFRGHLVPHMVVQGENGPVTVLVLAREQVDAPVEIEEEGFNGTIVPAGNGSIAVVGVEDEAIEPVRQRLVSAMEWQT